MKADKELRVYDKIPLSIKYQHIQLQNDTSNEKYLLSYFFCKYLLFALTRLLPEFSSTELTLIIFFKGPRLY